MLLGNSLRQTVHTHRASVHQTAKLVAALLRIVTVTAGMVGSNGSLPQGFWFMSPAGWLPRTGISCGTLPSAVSYLFLPCHHYNDVMLYITDVWQHWSVYVITKYSYLHLSLPVSALPSFCNDVMLYITDVRQHWSVVRRHQVFSAVPVWHGDCHVSMLCHSVVTHHVHDSRQQLYRWSHLYQHHRTGKINIVIVIISYIACRYHSPSREQLYRWADLYQHLWDQIIQ